MSRIDDRFDIQIDEEGVCRVLDHPDDTVMTFTVKDFGRFLTEFLSSVCNEEPDDS